MFRIVLTDGTTLNNLTKNGDNFIANYNITSDIFDNNLSPVTIFEDGLPEEHAHMELVQLIEFENAMWFVLRDLTDRELKDLKFRADIDYIAMMTDVDIEE